MCVPIFVLCMPTLRKKINVSDSNKEMTVVPSRSQPCSNLFPLSYLPIPLQEQT